MRMRWVEAGLLAVAVSLASAGAGAAQVERIELSAADLELSGPAVAVGRHMGRDALLMGGGSATLPEVAFLDGTIEFDLAVDRVRSFFGINFRMAGEDHSEDVYFRPHKSGLPDAIQYTPRFWGMGPWQLYHGEGFTAGADFGAGEWVHVRLEVQGRRAAVFVGDGAEPAMVIPELARAPERGSIELWSFVPGGAEAGVHPVRVSNLVVRNGGTSYAFGEPELTEPPEGLITRWALSKSFAPAEIPLRELPADLWDGEWRAVDAESFGVLVLDRLVEPIEDSPRRSAVAHVVLRAQRSTTARLDLGFSDHVSAFLNGRLLYSAQHDYSFNFPRRQGLITLDQATLYLPLEAGDNHLLLAVSERFGGWGLMGRLSDPAVEVVVPESGSWRAEEPDGSR